MSRRVRKTLSTYFIIHPVNGRTLAEYRAQAPLEALLRFRSDWPGSADLDVTVTSKRGG